MKPMKRASQRCGISQVARRELIWLIVSFVSLQAGLIAAIKYCLPALRDPVYAVRAGRLRERLVSASSSPFRIVMLGSSRTAFGFRGAMVEQQLQRVLHRPVVSCNLGCCGTAHLNELVILRRLLKDRLRPDLLLVEVVPPLLAGQPYAPREVDWLPPTRLDWNELADLEKYGPPLGNPRRDWLKAQPLPWYAHRFDILSWLSPQWVPVKLRSDWGEPGDPSGWTPHIAPDRSPAAYARGVERARKEYESFLAWFQISPASAGPLLDLLQLCRAERIPTALVLMPEGLPFRNLYPPFAWPKIDEFLAIAMREFTVPVINAREWIGDHEFSDSHHLLPEGAAQFTERLCRDALVPLYSASSGLQARTSLHDRGFLGE
jgi:hypothetical protein